MTLEDVIAAATQLAAAVEAGDDREARFLAIDVAKLAGRAELQTVALAAQRVVNALSEESTEQDDLGVAMIVLADEIALLIHGANAPDEEG
ncbi:hypothetical protein L2Y96_12555 [Luteibacter aegosomaticola]|uniref:hypothetical protein n=1 Tax=Luteibacter aegosomaticola TaxID=2911538 RepID=UPI001FFAC696|nr:hypothetical protein [Luteibacter aegosomaticola]UPG88250.1 hypothetical protein L2Y96_12555 [Luteibacter aegosomaticola]